MSDFGDICYDHGYSKGYAAGYEQGKRDAVVHGEWTKTARNRFDDWGDLIVYVTAHCSKCRKDYPYNSTIWSKTFERPDNMRPEVFYEKRNEYDEDVLKEAENRVLYSFCPECGAKMRGGALV